MYKHPCIIGYGTTSMIVKATVPTNEKISDKRSIDFALKIPFSFTTYQDRSTFESTQNFQINWTFKKSEKNEHDIEIFHQEFKIQQSLQHQNIVTLFQLCLETFMIDDVTKITVPILIFEYCEGGDMLEFIKKRNGVFFTNEEIRLFLINIVNALDYLHNHQKIAHRDLKLENLLISREGCVKICDFGLAIKFDPFNGKHITQTCGSLFNVAPEIIDCIPYLGPEVDCWSLGVVLYSLITFSMPFDNPKQRTANCINKLILEGQYDSSLLDSHDKQFKDIIQHLLVKDINKRHTISQIIKFLNQ